MSERDEIEEAIRAGANVPIPEEMERRLRGRLAEFRARVEERPPSRWRFPMLRTSAVAAAVALAAIIVLVLIPGRSSGRAYAAAVAQLRGAQSLQFAIVFNQQPRVAVDFSFLAPDYTRIDCSWGIEVREAGHKQLILMHATRKFIVKEGALRESIGDADQMLEQLRSLPPSGSAYLGEKQDGGRKLLGYRVRKEHQKGQAEMEVWVNTATRQVDHVDIVFQVAGKPVYKMQIANIRVNSAVDGSQFHLTPPAGYTAIAVPAETAPPVHQPRLIVSQSADLMAVVLPMTGPYTQTRAALEKVQEYLQQLGVKPAGPALGQYESQAHWEAGYPVPAGTKVEAPFRTTSLPGALSAIAVVHGPWGYRSDERWSAFLKQVIEQGWIPAGPPVEMWTGDEGDPAGQRTVMRIPVVRTE